MLNIVIWILLTSIACVLIDGPPYWWLPFGVVALFYILDTIDDMARSSTEE